MYRTKGSPCINLDPNCNENPTQGICFSPNGRFIYVSSYWSIKQLDTWDTDTATQWSYVFGLKNDGYFSTLYSSPDGKIYVGNVTNSHTAMTVIDSPDVKGMGCHVCYNCLTNGNYGFASPPNMPNYHLGAKVPCWPLATEEVLIKNGELEVYPNPTSTLLFIKTASKEKRELYNAIGQLKVSTKANEIAVRKLAKGMYYLRCGSAIKKVVIE